MEYKIEKNYLFINTFIFLTIDLLNFKKIRESKYIQYIS